MYKIAYLSPLAPDRADTSTDNALHSSCQLQQSVLRDQYIGVNIIVLVLVPIRHTCMVRPI